MAKGTSEQDDDARRGKSAEKQIISAKQAGAEDEDNDASYKLPSRVHIFANKPRTGDPSRSDRKPLQFSSLGPGTNRRTNWNLPDGAGQGAFLVCAQPPIIIFNEELLCLRQQIERRKKALYEAAMKAEDLEAVIQGLQRTWNAIAKRRR